MTVLSCARLVDLDSAGWGSLSLLEDVYADANGEVRIFLPLLSYCSLPDSCWCSGSSWTSAFSRSVALLTVILYVVYRTRPTKLHRCS